MEYETKIESKMEAWRSLAGHEVEETELDILLSKGYSDVSLTIIANTSQKILFGDKKYPNLPEISVENRYCHLCEKLIEDTGSHNSIVICANSYLKSPDDPAYCSNLVCLNCCRIWG